VREKDGESKTQAEIAERLWRMSRKVETPSRVVSVMASAKVTWEARAAETRGCARVVLVPGPDA
jgi:hypothetical protein